MILALEFLQKFVECFAGCAEWKKKKKLLPLIATNESSDNVINTHRGGHIWPRKGKSKWAFGGVGAIKVTNKQIYENVIRFIVCVARLVVCVCGAIAADAGPSVCLWCDWSEGA